jgi:hypothetical protein
VSDRGTLYRHVSKELDVDRSPTACVVALHGQGWRVEDAYAIVQGLLSLACSWCGTQNAVEIQVRAPGLLHAVRVDLPDYLARAPSQRFAAISMQMIHLSLHVFAQSHQRSQAEELVAQLAANAKRLGIVKRKRKSAHPSPTKIHSNLDTSQSTLTLDRWDQAQDQCYFSHLDLDSGSLGILW